MEEIQAVQTMQEYIRIHHQDEGFSLSQVCSAAGYSRRQADRLFQKHLHKTMWEYTRAVRLTASAHALLHTDKPVLDVALDSHFSSHEGFSRSFFRYFHITPSSYRERQIAVPWFVQYPISHYYAMRNQKEDHSMDNNVAFCTVTAKERPRRKLIYLRSRTSRDYLSFCEEMGCEWEGLLNSIPEKMETAALLELPEALTSAGYSKVAAGIEVPMDYGKPLPPEYQTAELPESTILFFQTEPYEKEEDFGKAIACAYAAVRRYDPELYGYRFACELAPFFNFGAEPKAGARLAVPAVQIK